MKKYILVCVLMFLSIRLYSQVNIGLSVQPGILANRVSTDVDTLRIDNNGSKVKLWLGIFFDMELRKNYYFTLGLNWAPKNIRLKMVNDNGQNTLNVKLQYLQIPLWLKLYTDEIALDKRLYFQLGPALEFKLEQSPDKSMAQFYIDKINFWDIGLHFGTGMEFRLGENTMLSGGLFYYRGLVNAIKTDSALSGKIRAKNDFYALNLSIKF
jgi:hypothetical protein